MAEAGRGDLREGLLIERVDVVPIRARLERRILRPVGRGGVAPPITIGSEPVPTHHGVVNFEGGKKENVDHASR